MNRTLISAVFGMAMLAMAGTTGPAIAQATPATAKISDDVVKIGLILDMSGVYADIVGEGSVVAARLAI